MNKFTHDAYASSFIPIEKQESREIAKIIMNLRNKMEMQIYDIEQELETAKFLLKNAENLIKSTDLPVCLNRISTISNDLSCYKYKIPKLD